MSHLSDSVKVLGIEKKSAGAEVKKSHLSVRFRDVEMIEDYSEGENTDRKYKSRRRQ